jgi:hypothetical protein
LDLEVQQRINHGMVVYRLMVDYTAQRSCGQLSAYAGPCRGPAFRAPPAPAPARRWVRLRPVAAEGAVGPVGGNP